MNYLNEILEILSTNDFTATNYKGGVYVVMNYRSNELFAESQRKMMDCLNKNGIHNVDVEELTFGVIVKPQ